MGTVSALAGDGGSPKIRNIHIIPAFCKEPAACMSQVESEIQPKWPAKYLYPTPEKGTQAETNVLNKKPEAVCRDRGGDEPGGMCGISAVCMKRVVEPTEIYNTPADSSHKVTIDPVKKSAR